MNKQNQTKQYLHQFAVYVFVGCLALASVACRQTESGAANTAAPAANASGNSSATNASGSSVATNVAKTDSSSGSNAAKTDSASSGSNAARTPKEVFEAYLAAEKRKDSKGMNEQLSADSIKFTRDQFAEEAKKTGKSVDALMEEGLAKNTASLVVNPEYGKEEIKGDAATLEVTEKGKPGFLKMPFVRENGRWKIALSKFYEESFGVLKKAGEELQKR